MNALQTIKRILTPATSQKEQVVERLLVNGSITPAEAVLLLREKPVVNIRIDKLEMSSGAKIVQGDDNETNYRD